MSSTWQDAPPAASETVVFPCTFAEGRAASVHLCSFLAQYGLTPAELFACELALTEACNNAVQHVGTRGRVIPVTASARCSPAQVELRVTDHTDGFDWPAGELLPPGPEAEHGRGVFIIRSVMDGAFYTRGPEENTLTMWKGRMGARPKAPRESPV